MRMLGLEMDMVRFELEMDMVWFGLEMDMVRFGLEMDMVRSGLEMDMVEFGPKVQHSCYSVEYILGLQGMAGWLKDIGLHQ